MGLVLMLRFMRGSDDGHLSAGAAERLRLSGLVVGLGSNKQKH